MPRGAGRCPGLVLSRAVNAERGERSPRRHSGILLGHGRGGSWVPGGVRGRVCSSSPRCQQWGGQSNQGRKDWRRLGPPAPLALLPRGRAPASPPPPRGAGGRGGGCLQCPVPPTTRCPCGRPSPAEAEAICIETLPGRNPSNIWLLLSSQLLT